MREKQTRCLKNLAEAIIMQAIEDLWSSGHRRQSIAFFFGEGFKVCSRASGIAAFDQARLMRVVSEAVRDVKGIRRPRERYEHNVAG